MKNNAMPTTKPTQQVYALLAGGGALPGLVAAAVEGKGSPLHLITFAGQPHPAAEIAAASNKQFSLGQVGHILAHLKANKVTHVVLAGHLSKPNILSLKPDAMGLKLLARAVIKHDDALLRSVTDFMQEEGFTIVPPHTLVPGLLAPAGLLSKTRPNAEEVEDIALARSTLAVLGDLDIGQAAVVFNGAVLGVEGAEGTDELVRRCAVLRGEGGKGGILVKRAKPLQTDLADLPFVGPRTMQVLAEHHYRGLVVQAGKTLLLNQPEMVDLANHHHLFLQAD